MFPYPYQKREAQVTSGYPGFLPYWLNLPGYQNHMGYPGYGAYPSMYGIPFGGANPLVGNPLINREVMGYPVAPGFDPQAQFLKQPGDPQRMDDIEIVDVSPEVQRRMLGWPAEDPGVNEHSTSGKPRYTVDVDTQTSNKTVIPHNLSKPFINEKKYLTTIRKSFVYDSKNPEPIKPVNIHIVNGEQVTTTPPPETTVDENVVGIKSWYTD
ncbi:uncharacterized protein LOC126744468 isoform X2 [Anthonomus grandis grandis]|nr:uncharacterized protein LOC126744468 isoform X2 [Anthonomus grandis grandis]